MQNTPLHWRSSPGELGEPLKLKNYSLPLLEASMPQPSEQAFLVPSFFKDAHLPQVQAANSNNTWSLPQKNKNKLRFTGSMNSKPLPPNTEMFGCPHPYLKYIKSDLGQGSL